MIFLDFLKAFDTVLHVHLIAKVSKMELTDFYIGS